MHPEKDNFGNFGLRNTYDVGLIRRKRVEYKKIYYVKVKKGHQVGVF